jgi:putative membrane protein insertion efficiency factor
MRLVLAGLIRFYQLVVSPLLPRACRFYPSCSQYALEAIMRHGALRGSALAAARLARCHPWNPGGVDFIPLRLASLAQDRLGQRDFKRGS